MTEDVTEAEERINLQSRVYGSHTITLGAVVQSPDHICVPRSREIKTWSTTERVNSISTPHRSIITFISQSPPSGSGSKFCVSCDWNGMIAVYDSDWNFKYSFLAPNPPATSVKFLSPDKIAVLSRGHDNFKPGCVVIYQLGETGVIWQSRELLDTVWQIACHQRELYVWKWVEPVFTLIKFDENLDVVKEFEMMSEKSASIGHAISEKHIVLAFVSRDLILLDSNTMTLRDSSKLQAVSKSPIWAIQFVSEDEILLQQSRENFIVLNVISGEIIKTFEGPPGFVCYMKLSDLYLWIGTVDGVFRVKFSSDELYQESKLSSSPLELKSEMSSFLYHEIACCGVSVNENLIVSGDLGGNILVWDSNLPNENPVFRTRIEDSVRCLNMVRRGESVTVFIGTLSGCLLQWELGREPHVVTHREDTITCIRTTSESLCFGMVTGDIEVLEISYTADHQDLVLTKLFDLKVHYPTESETDLRFGSLNIKAEIWSLEFSPCATKIATCSEDQTVRITSLDTRETISTFKDHTLAVTSLSWVLCSGLSLLISCSDDNTIVVRETVTEVKLKTLPLPSEVIGFCTLTYLGVLTSEEASERNLSITDSNVREVFEECKDKMSVVCGSENGYLIVRELVEGRVLFNERVHQGSIEGLACQGTRVITCSSDCCVQIHEVLLRR